MSSGIKISLMEKQLQINASVNNIFMMRYKVNIYFNDNEQSFNNYWDGRAFRLSVNYTFWNKRNKSKENINFEEKTNHNPFFRLFFGYSFYVSSKNQCNSPEMGFIICEDKSTGLYSPKRTSCSAFTLLLPVAKKLLYQHYLPQDV